MSILKAKNHYMAAEISKQFVTELIETFRHQITNPLLPEFIRQFYAHLPAEEFNHAEPQEWFNIANSMVKFAAFRKASEPKIRVYNPDIEHHGWSSPYTIIEMVNNDMPFLVDSITAELNRQGFKIYEIVHPIMYMKRDASGELIEVLSVEDAARDPEAAIESIMHFQVSTIGTQSALEALEAGLYYILKNVYHAVQDWRPMLGQLEQLMQQLPKAFLQQEYSSETIAFLKWLSEDNFTFLGCVSYHISAASRARTPITNSEKGIFHVMGKELHRTIARHEIESESRGVMVEIGKINKMSPVHRSAYLDYIKVTVNMGNGADIEEHYFLGLFTSIVYYQSATLIPLIRKKIDAVLRRSGFNPTSHTGKELVTILQAFPRDELFQYSEEELYHTCMGILALLVRPRVRAFIRIDHTKQFTHCMIFVPRERFSTAIGEKIQQMVMKLCGGTMANQAVLLSDSLLARWHFIIHTPEAVTEIPIETIEDSIEALTGRWDDAMRLILMNQYGAKKGEILASFYEGAFPVAYKDKFTAEMTVKDILKIEQAFTEQRVTFDIQDTHEENIWQLKIYSPEQHLPLSTILPILEHMSFFILDEHAFQIQGSKGEKNTARTCWLHLLRLKPSQSVHIGLSAVKPLIEEALFRIWQKDAQDDGFNMLIIAAGLTWRQTALLRGFSKYLRQIRFPYSELYIQEVLVKYPSLTGAIISLFEARFCPDLLQPRDTQCQHILHTIQKGMLNVKSSSEDKVLKRMVELCQAITRTNYYQRDLDGQFKPYISFKCDSQKVQDLPLPKPYAEIFVCSPRVEAIHLRGGKVARGGLRWSDRSEDFRTEVLGLVKAQMAKNAVIVPVGSKGGFVVKQPPQEDREALLKEAIFCYQTFLRGLLDITDNFVNGTVTPPLHVIRHDEDDPYLVVAADKGTATFSDIANAIAREYHFWLDDAFASGGSAGYDHKKMGITARGAWVSVERHFRELNIDIQCTDFTVVGIGDMSGDVFGNGMLLSQHIQLVGAFNHIHIFIDPNPDAAKSFAERKRLFELPRSTWMDYDRSLISEGGGIFERSAKSIPISAAMKERFGLTQDEISPELLIQALLKAPIDLLWNGGIGTYVKASDETNEMVGDKTNDLLRINGRELRCKVVGEGGNLGFTQRGRIEYARKGGCINTDAIDNSAGVDCSDHEVNIKICLTRAIQLKLLKPDDRNPLLEAMTDSVAALVLRDNQLQTQALSMAQSQGIKLMELQARLIGILEKEGILDRHLEFLPSESEISRRLASQEPFTRPELAVQLAYSKLSIYNHLLNSTFPDEPYLEQDLLNYFPEIMQEKFAQAIKEHPLRREIIATIASNSIVNRAGSMFFHLSQEDTGLKGCDIARAYIIARDAFELEALWKEIEALDGKVPVSVQMDLFWESKRLLQRIIFWLLRNAPQPLDMGALVAEITPAVSSIKRHLQESLVGEAKLLFEKRRETYISEGVPAKVATQVASLSALASACDLVQILQQQNVPYEQVARVYFAVGTRFQLVWLRSAINQLNAENYWQRLSLQTLLEDMFDQHRRLAAEIVKEGSNLEEWCTDHEKQVARYDEFLALLKSQDAPEFAMLVVAAKRLDALIGG